MKHEKSSINFDATKTIAQRLLEAGRDPGATVPTQETSMSLEELETKDYKLMLDNRAKTLLIYATDERGILIKVNLQGKLKNWN